MSNHVELLAPAGSMEGFLGAIHAGADAVYLGGNKFGARAYAQNFTDDEVCSAIKYAHLFNRKVYITINTLLRDEELKELISYMAPFYECGIDGVIIQDLGVLKLLKDVYPRLELHASTQMAITGSYGAKLLKEMGVCRIVPARELSIKELRQIKDKTGIQLETFIHGAMCYSYSGNCLMSSVLGGRSGNRGRCAGPCRLPYQVSTAKGSDSKEQYYLSLKDLCSISFLPELIEAGIDSFKIEGRMKQPEYTAGVTELYRKYIDLYYKNGKENYKVSMDDMEKLRKLYIRSAIFEGYYHTANGREMITLEKPSYLGTDEAILNSIKETHLNKTLKLPVYGKFIGTVSERVELVLICKDRKVIVEGFVMEEAMKQPATIETITKQLKKTGNTYFEFSKLDVSLQGNGFVPVKALNELRRDAFTKLEQVLLQNTFRTIPDVGVALTGGNNSKNDSNGFSVLVSTKEQLDAALGYSYIKRLYVSYEIVFHEGELLKGLTEKLRQRGSDAPELYIAFPYVLRENRYDKLERLKSLLMTKGIRGALIRNLESLQYLREISYSGEVVSDAGLYAYNKEADKVYESFGLRTTIPYELSGRQSEELDIKSMERIIYGHIPMMITANCLKKTTGYCQYGQKNSIVKKNDVTLTDRYKKNLTVHDECEFCYNIIYNSVPLSLHNELNKGYLGQGVFRLNFTIENWAETRAVLSYYEEYSSQNLQCEFPMADYTKGHFKHGVE